MSVPKRPNKKNSKLHKESRGYGSFLIYFAGLFVWSLSGSRLRMRQAGRGQDVRPEKTKQKSRQKYDRDEKDRDLTNDENKLKKGLNFL